MSAAVAADADGRRDLLYALNALLAIRLWAYLESQPGFTEGLRAAEAELAAGVGVLYEVRGNRLVKVKGRTAR